MTSMLYYLFQVMLCSAILMGYYTLVLRDKKFHHYNRFYLMAVIVLSWTVPLIDIHWTGQGEGQVSEVVNFIALQNTQWKQAPTKVWSNTELLGLLLYAAVGLFLAVKMLRAYWQLLQLQQQHTHTVVGKVKFFQTDMGEAPFSFFNAIFWNRAIDPQTPTGQKMMAHELTHVREKHSIDKMFLQANRALGWFNPFFWLLAKEMDMVHEYIADQKTVDEGDAAALAEILLAAAQPKTFLGLTHPFFFSPIQRRLKMIAANNKTPFSYLRRVVALPLLALVLVLVSFKQKDANTQHLSMATVMENLANPVLKTGADLSGTTSATDTVVLSADSIYVVPSGKRIKLIDDPNGPNAITEVRVVEKKGVGFVGGVDSSAPNKGIVIGGPKGFNSNGQNPLLVLDGVKVPYEKIMDLNPNDIATVNVKRDKSAVLVWGEEAKYGAIEVITKGYAKANKIDVLAIPVEPLNKVGADGKPMKVVKGQALQGAEAPTGKVVEGQPLKIVEGRPLMIYEGHPNPMKTVEGQPLKTGTGKVFRLADEQVDSFRAVPSAELVEVMGYALPNAPKVADKTIIVLNGKVITWKDLEAFPTDRIAGIKIEKGTGGSAKKIIILEKAPDKIEVKEVKLEKVKQGPPPPPPPAKKKKN